MTRYFVDTNVLVYRRDTSEAAKQQLADAWLRYLWQQECGRLSFQVLQEYYHVVTHKLSPGMPPSEARADVDDFLNWQPLSMNGALLAAAWSIEDRLRLSWWDSLIVAAAQAASADYLLSEDLQDGLNVDGVVVLNPFKHAVPQ